MIHAVNSDWRKRGSGRLHFILKYVISLIIYSTHFRQCLCTVETRSVTSVHTHLAKNLTPSGNKNKLANQCIQCRHRLEGAWSQSFNLHCVTYLCESGQHRINLASTSCLIVKKFRVGILTLAFLVVFVSDQWHIVWTVIRFPDGHEAPLFAAIAQWQRTSRYFFFSFYIFSVENDLISLITLMGARFKANGTSGLRKHMLGKKLVLICFLFASTFCKCRDVMFLCTV